MERLVQLSDGDWYKAKVYRGEDRDNGGTDGWILHVEGSREGMWVPLNTPMQRIRNAM